MIRSAQLAIGTSSPTVVAEGSGDGGTALVLNKGANIVYLGGANNEVQNVAFTGGPTGGDFTLTFSGQTTAAIPFDATPAQVEAALEALTNVAVGDVHVRGSDLPAGIITVEFVGGVHQGANVAEMTGSAAGLTGGSAPSVAVTTVVQGGVTSGTGFELANGAQVTVILSGEDKLLAISSAGAATVHVLQHIN